MDTRIFFTILLSLTLVSCSQQTYSYQAHQSAADETVNWLIKQHGEVKTPYTDYYFGELANHLQNSISSTPTLRNAVLKGSADWRISILNSDQPNAFSAGAGHIAVTRGIVCAMKNEAELAAVVAHEMSHELLHHTRETYMSVNAESGPSFSYQSDQEMAADSMAFEILAAAGYSQKAALDAFFIAYRPELKGYGAKVGSWRSLRASNLYTLVKNSNHIDKPAKSRAFNKLKIICKK